MDGMVEIIGSEAEAEDTSVHFHSLEPGCNVTLSVPSPQQQQQQWGHQDQLQLRITVGNRQLVSQVVNLD